MGFARLQRNLCGFEQAVIYNKAVSDKNGRSSFYLHTEESGWGSMFCDHDSRERIEVSTIRLDDWAQQDSIARLDFVKIDIEGGEYAALIGARTLLKRFQPVIVAELNSVCLWRDQRTTEDVLALLCEAGYHCERTDKSVIATPEAVPAPFAP